MRRKRSGRLWLGVVPAGLIVAAFLMKGNIAFTKLFEAKPADREVTQSTGEHSPNGSTGGMSVETPGPQAGNKAEETPAPAPADAPQPAEAGSITVLVNKSVPLPEDYAPADLVIPNVPFPFKEDLPKKYLRKEAAEALERLFAGAKRDGMELYGISGYRSYATQVAVYNQNVKTQGVEAANRVSAIPGHSEHQTGLAIDVSSRSAKFGLEEEFGDTPEGKWLAQHAPEYGFIIRYPKGKEEITGYAYEPWHIRYVGVKVAQEVTRQGITLDEYLEAYMPQKK
ncbi:M15 family metallopeptidase [Brevibacillus massiliensis]|jgi:D-alanyl-D-alanine carboxypeptidase|uniref:M15 family metallopeptidase n=1 Tax=Brevibacillus massiliensis TaxID=1118054 RepID=UPI0003170D3B|nr:M15 family metallopeptidase [Brevibacillus massiliensis]